MSLLLRKSVTSAARAGARRRLPSSSSYSNDVWFPSAERSLWHEKKKNGKDYYYSYNNSSVRSLGTTARSMVTSSWKDQDDHENSKTGTQGPKGQLLVNPSMLGAPPVISRGSCVSPVDHSTLRSLSLVTTTAAKSSSSYSREFSSRARLSGRNFVRYVPPPGSLRSNLVLSQMMATERLASDAAFRAFTTWFLSSNNNHFYNNNRNNNRPDVGLRFVSMNSDGSRSRHPDLVRRGIRKTKIPMPPSGDPNEQKSLKPENIMKEINTKSKTVVLPALLSGLKKVFVFLLNMPKNLFFYLMNPSEVATKWKSIKKVIKDEVDHYWVGTKVRLISACFVRAGVCASARNFFFIDDVLE